MVLLQSNYVPGWLDSWLTSEFGLIILLGLCLLEGTMLLRFMPSELVVPTALLFIGTSVPEVVGVVAIAVVGTTIGQAVLFLVVRRGGREYVLERGWLPVSEQRWIGSMLGSTAGACLPSPSVTRCCSFADSVRFRLDSRRCGCGPSSCSRRWARSLSRPFSQYCISPESGSSSSSYSR